MPSNVKIACFVSLCLAAMFAHVYQQKKQFYPTVVYLSKSGAAIALVYAQAVVLGLMASTILRKIFFGDLRPIESERLVERSWYALTETCLAFTIFRDETVPGFVVFFAFLIFMKTFHWLSDERVDLIERSMVIPKLFHLRIISVFLILGAIDASFIALAYHSTVAKGPSIQVVFGFEYCILFASLLGNIVKYSLYIQGLLEYATPDDRNVTQMYVSVVMSSLTLALHSIFFVLMMQIFTFPLFLVRPMFFALKAFKKSVTNVMKMRRAFRYLNELYPDVIPEDLEIVDSSCIICREELSLASKKLPCGHIFHTACLRAWFQRQQSCPTCRFRILQVSRVEQLQRLRTTHSAHVSTQTEHTHFLCPHSHHFLQIHEIDRYAPFPNTDNLTIEQLENLENERKEALKIQIQTLSELSCMLETASSVIQQFPSTSQLISEPANSKKTAKSPMINQNGAATEISPADRKLMLRAKRSLSLNNPTDGNNAVDGNY